jgi:formate dehydrogenase major subunit/formate dehydrogenase alpha subunit
VTVAGLAAAFGSGAMTNAMGEVEDTDLILITGSNTAECHPIIGRMVKRAVDRKRAKLIVVDPRRIELVKFARIWLRPRPGTDIAWINAMVHVILEEGLWDKEYVEKRTEGFEELRAGVADYSPERAEQITGIPADDLRRAARSYARAPKAMILYAMGITQHTTGTDNVKALANLAMLCGRVGIEGGGLNPLRGQNNVQGACDMGALPNVLPGYQSVKDEEVLARFQQGWSTGVRLSDRIGLTVTEMFPAASKGEVRALLIMGENPMLSDANTSHVKKALESLDFLIVQDIFLTETARMADVVLPAASFAEKDGTFTNTERRVQRVRKALDPPGSAMTDWEIICGLAKRVSAKIQAHRAAMAEGESASLFLRPFSHGYWDYKSAAEIFEELTALVPAYAGMSYDRLERGGLQWPCPNKYHPGTPVLHKDRFVRGLGKFHSVEYIPPAEEPDEAYPFFLSTGRIRFHYHTGTMTRRSRGLNCVAPEGFVEMNPQDGLALDIRDGDRVRLVSRRGEMTSRVRLTDRSPRGMIFSTFHFRESPVNMLTNDALDPTGKIPEYKVCAVRVEKTEEGGFSSS